VGSSNKLNPICSGRIGQPPKLGANTANRHLPVGPLTTNEICVPIIPSISPSIVFDRNKSAKSRINRSFSLFVLDSAPTQKGAARSLAFVSLNSSPKCLGLLLFWVPSPFGYSPDIGKPRSSSYCLWQLESFDSASSSIYIEGNGRNT
jgi:hypothetical protein